MKRRYRGEHAARRFGRGPSSDLIKVVRWPAILLLAAAVASMVALDSRADGSSDPVVVERAIGSAVGDADALASTWYCSAGSIVEGGIGDHVVVLANPAPVEATVSLTIVPVLAPTPITLDLGEEGEADDASDAPTTTDIEDTIGQAPEAIVLDTVRQPAVVPAYSVQRVRLADIDGVGGEFAAVLVESDLGELAVEHELTGPTGSSTAPCASASSEEWFFAAGTTRKGSQQYLSVFNPFPGDAVVDITLAVDGVLRSPRAYDGLVVPSGAVVPVDLGAVVTLFDSVAATVSARTGRVVVDRLIAADGTEGPIGLSVSPGVASAADTWVLPGGVPSEPTAIAIYNPSSTLDAVVDVELRPPAGFDVFIEPVGVTVRPGRTELVVLTPGADQITSGRVVDAAGRAPADTSYWLVVRQLRGDGVVVERFVVSDDATAHATSAAPAASVAALRHVLTTGSGRGAVAIAHTAEDRLALVEITVAAGGEVFSIAPLELAAADRQLLDLGELGVPADAVMIIEASEPVHVERRLDTGGGLHWTPVLPERSSLVEPVIPFG